MTQAEYDRRYRRRKSARGKREEARRLRDEANQRAAEQGNGVDHGVHCMDINHVTPEMLPGVPDAIITDPPYARECLPLFSSLSRFAEKVLKPGGWCAVMGGQIFLPELMRRLSEHLTYRWQYVLPLLGGGHTVISSVGVFEDYKTVLLFQKPPVTRMRECWGGLIPSKTAAVLEQSKQLHKWQQPQTAFEEIVNRLTVAGNLVVDPFAGSGTTGRAAIKLSRHFWGCDIDEDCATAPLILLMLSLIAVYRSASQK